VYGLNKRSIDLEFVHQNILQMITFFFRDLVVLVINVGKIKQRGIILG